MPDNAPVEEGALLDAAYLVSTSHPRLFRSSRCRADVSVANDFRTASEGRRCVVHKGAVQISMDSVLKLLLVTELNLCDGLFHPLPRTQNLAGTSV